MTTDPIREMKSTRSFGQKKKADPLARLLAAVLIAGGVGALYYLSSVNYISYVLLARLVTISIAFTIFSVGWNTRKYATNTFYLALSACYLFVGLSDLIHLGLITATTTTPEMESQSVTMNIRAVARFFEALAFPTATLLALSGRTVRDTGLLLGGLLLWLALIGLAASDILPTSFEPGLGFALYYQLFIVLLSVALAASVILLEMHREAHERSTRRLLEIYISLNVLTNLLSLFITDFQGQLYFYTLVIKLGAYLVLYRALVKDTLNAPYYSLFLNLTDSEVKARRARLEAEDASREKSEFIASVSHEIRTPMSAIIGLSNLMLSTELTHTQRRYAALTRQSANTLLTLINQILDYTKLEEHKMKLEQVVFDLGDLVGGVVEIFSLLSAGTQVKITSELDPLPPGPLKGDAQKLRQVLLNLISNAVKFTEKGSVDVRATSKVLPGGKVKVEITITDTGPGIPETEIPKLFIPYEQGASNKGRIVGTGLGLSISKSIVELLGGTISVASETGKGSVFCFNAFFDLAPSEKVQKGDAAPEMEPGGLEGLRVLVADDNEVNRFYATDLLTGMGFAVDAVSDGSGVLTALERVEYDLVLMDVRMPGVNGLEATRRARDAGKSVPVIGLTADGSAETAQECVASGMNAILVKPFEEEAFLDTLKRVVRESGRVPREHRQEPAGEVQELTQFADRYRNNPEKFKQIVGMFLEDCANHLADIDLASERGDMAVVSERAHALRGCFVVFGAQEAAALTREVEDLAAADDREKLKNRIETLMTRMAGMEEYLKGRVSDALTSAAKNQPKQQ